MAVFEGQAGPFKLCWDEAPLRDEGQVRVSWEDARDGSRGQEIVAYARLGGGRVRIEWARGLSQWSVATPAGSTSDGEARTYRVTRAASAEVFEGLRFVRAGERAGAAAGGAKKGPSRVRAHMPGKVVRILVEVGAQVEKDQPLMVIEAMKMENEMRAVSAGTVQSIAVTAGQAVESGAELMRIE